MVAHLSKRHFRFLAEQAHLVGVLGDHLPEHVHDGHVVLRQTVHLPLDPQEARESSETDTIRLRLAPGPGR